MPSYKRMFCTKCHQSVIPLKVKWGHVFFSPFLYFLYIIPGLIYSLMRRVYAATICPVCATATLIPHKSPVAVSLQDGRAVAPEVVKFKVKSGRKSQKHKVNHMVWKMTYVDAKGDKTERVVTVKGIKQSDRKNYIIAYCHLRKSYRTFLANNILDILNMETGEIYETKEQKDNLYKSLIPSESESQESKKILKKIENEIIVLAYISELDGFIHNFEIDVASHYLMDKYFDHDVDEKMLSAMFYSMRPTESDFNDALVKLKKAKKLDGLKRYLMQLVEADGVVTPEEAAAVSKINGALN